MNKKILKLLMAAALGLSLFSATQNAIATEDSNSYDRISDSNDNGAPNISDFDLNSFVDKINNHFSYENRNSVKSFVNDFAVECICFFENYLKSSALKALMKNDRNTVSKQITEEILKPFESKLNLPVKEVFSAEEYRKTFCSVIGKCVNIFEQKFGFRFLSNEQIDYLEKRILNLKESNLFEFVSQNNLDYIIERMIEKGPASGEFYGSVEKLFNLYVQMCTVILEDSWKFVNLQSVVKQDEKDEKDEKDKKDKDRKALLKDCLEDILDEMLIHKNACSSRVSMVFSEEQYREFCCRFMATFNNRISEKLCGVKFLSDEQLYYFEKKLLDLKSLKESSALAAQSLNNTDNGSRVLDIKSLKEGLAPSAQSLNNTDNGSRILDIKSLKEGLAPSAQSFNITDNGKQILDLKSFKENLAPSAQSFNNTDNGRRILDIKSLIDELSFLCKNIVQDYYDKYKSNTFINFLDTIHKFLNYWFKKKVILSKSENEKLQQATDRLILEWLNRLKHGESLKCVSELYNAEDFEKEVVRFFNGLRRAVLENNDVVAETNSKVNSFKANSLTNINFDLKEFKKRINDSLPYENLQFFNSFYELSCNLTYNLMDYLSEKNSSMFENSEMIKNSENVANLCLDSMRMSEKAKNALADLSVLNKEEYDYFCFDFLTKFDLVFRNMLKYKVLTDSDAECLEEDMKKLKLSLDKKSLNYAVNQSNVVTNELKLSTNQKEAGGLLSNDDLKKLVDEIKNHCGYLKYGSLTIKDFVSNIMYFLTDCFKEDCKLDILKDLNYDAKAELNKNIIEKVLKSFSSVERDLPVKQVVGENEYFKWFGGFVEKYAAAFEAVLKQSVLTKSQISRLKSLLSGSNESASVSVDEQTQTGSSSKNNVNLNELANRIKENFDYDKSAKRPVEDVVKNFLFYITDYFKMGCKLEGFQNLNLLQAVTINQSILNESLNLFTKREQQSIVKEVFSKEAYQKILIRIIHLFIDKYETAFGNECKILSGEQVECLKSLLSSSNESARVPSVSVDEQMQANKVNLDLLLKNVYQKFPYEKCRKAPVHSIVSHVVNSLREYFGTDCKIKGVKRLNIYSLVASVLKLIPQKFHGARVENAIIEEKYEAFLINVIAGFVNRCGQILKSRILSNEQVERLSQLKAQIEKNGLSQNQTKKPIVLKVDLESLVEKFKGESDFSYENMADFSVQDCVAILAADLFNFFEACLETTKAVSEDPAVKNLKLGETAVCEMIEAVVTDILKSFSEENAKSNVNEVISKEKYKDFYINILKKCREVVENNFGCQFLTDIQMAILQKFDPTKKVGEIKFIKSCNIADSSEKAEQQDDLNDTFDGGSDKFDNYLDEVSFKIAKSFSYDICARKTVEELISDFAREFVWHAVGNNAGLSADFDASKVAKNKDVVVGEILKGLKMLGSNQSEKSLARKLLDLQKEFASNYEKYKKQSLHNFILNLDDKFKDNKILEHVKNLDVRAKIKNSRIELYKALADEIHQKTFDHGAPYNDPLSKVCNETQFKKHINKFFVEIIDIVSGQEPKKVKISKTDLKNFNLTEDHLVEDYSEFYVRSVFPKKEVYAEFCSDLMKKINDGFKNKTGYSLFEENQLDCLKEKFKKLI